MMDPLSALSLTGTIIQLVDFGSRLLSNSVQLYKATNGILKVHEELKLAVGDLKSVAVKLRRSPSTGLGAPTRPLTADEQRQEHAFKRLCDEAAVVAEEFLSRLEGLKVGDGKHPRWESFKAAVRVAWSQDEIDSLQKRLSTLKESLNSRVILSIAQKIDVETLRSSTRFDSLDVQTQRILVAIVESQDDLSHGIINSIAKMLCRLEAVNRDEHHNTRQAIIDLRNAVLSRQDPVNVITAQVEMLDVCHDEEQDLRSSISRKILESLSYPCMTDRYEDILQAHPKTFDWIYSNTKTWRLPWSDFRKWLTDDGGLYWIYGKAGSGKSTLMKHIVDDDRTKRDLRTWGQIAPTWGECCIAKFFFWNSGTTVQKSQKGLLRPLLFQVLGKHHDLIPIVFPTRWAEMYSGTPDLAKQIVPEPWSLKQLYDAFERLIQQKQYPLKLCFFIDGLDEFSGDTEELCMLIKRSSANSENAKFCVSSRPWVEFHRNFEGHPSLRLQDLTTNDINIYVNDKLRGNSAFMRLATRNVDLASSLTKEIVERAEGVFLWVQVVVRLLLRGLDNKDNVSQLWTRLRSFPRELYSLYDLILSQIDPIYLEWISRAFQIMTVSQHLSSDPFERLAKRPLEPNVSGNEATEQLGTSPLTLIEFLLSMEADHISSEISTMSVAQLQSRLDDARFHLMARCMGLLDVSEQKIRLLSPRSPPFYRVLWMHRTARDFVTEDKKWSKILLDETPPGFSAHYALMRACILTSSVLSGPTLGVPFSRATFALNAYIYGYHANGDAATRQSRTELLTVLMDAKLDIRTLPFQPTAFLERATMYCLSDFVEDKLASEKTSTRELTARKLLTYLCSRHVITSEELPLPTKKMVKSLLNLSGFSARIASGRAKADSVRPPGVSGTDRCEESERINPLSISPLLENRLSLIEIFLRAGVDPFHNLSFIPLDFVLQKKVVQASVENALENAAPSGAGGPSQILWTLQKTLEQEVKRHVMKLQEPKKKRKQEPGSTIEVIDISDDSDERSPLRSSDTEARSGGKRAKREQHGSVYR